MNNVINRLDYIDQKLNEAIILLNTTKHSYLNSQEPQNQIVYKRYIDLVYMLKNFLSSAYQEISVLSFLVENENQKAFQPQVLKENQRVKAAISLDDSFLLLSDKELLEEFYTQLNNCNITVFDTVIYNIFISDLSEKSGEIIAFSLTEELITKALKKGRERIVCKNIIPSKNSGMEIIFKNTEKFSEETP